MASKLLGRLDDLLMLANRMSMKMGYFGSFQICHRSYASDNCIGFIGIGNMGGHMANNLAKNCYNLVVHDSNVQSMEAFRADGVMIARSAKEVADECKIIVTMLPASQHVQDVYTGPAGIFQSCQAGSLLIDSSTIDPSVSIQMSQLADNAGAIYVDAPVSGGVLAARDALLTFMVGAPDHSIFVQAADLLEKMGKNVMYCGPVGTGQAAKICNNMLLAISMIGTSEAMNLGMRLGLDPKLLSSIFNMSTGRCWSSEVYNPVPGVVPGVPASNDYNGGFGTALMAKDLGLAQNAATVTRSPTPLGSLAHQVYRLMTACGYGSKDFSVAYQFLQDRTKH